MNKWIWSAVLVSGLAVAAAVVAEPGPKEGREGRQGGPEGRGGPGGHGGMPPIERILEHPGAIEKLGLTTEQVDSLKSAAYAHQKEMIEKHAQVQLARLEVENLMRADNPDKDAIMKAIDAASLVQTEVKKAQVAHMLQTREILGPDAVAKIKAFMQERRAEMRDKGGRGEGRPGPRGQDGFRGPGKGGPGAGGPQDRSELDQDMQDDFAGPHGMPFMDELDAAPEEDDII